MRLLFPIGSLYPSQQGGPSNTMYWLAEGLANAGHQVTAISTDIMLPADTPRDQWLETSFGRVRYCRVKSAAWCIPVIWHSLRNWSGIDAVHLNSLYHFPAFFLANWGVLTGKKVIWSVRGNLMQAALGYNSGPKKWVHRWIRHILAPKVIFHATSPEETLAIQRVIRPDAQIVEVPNGMKLPEKQERKQETGILYLGRIHPIKSLENIFEAYALLPVHLRSKYPLWLAGTGNAAYIAQLQSLAESLRIAPQVKWLGEIRGEAKEQMLANARVLVLASASENFGNVVIEALAQGTPAIASSGTPWQSLKENQVGYWVDNKPDPLCAALYTILDMPQEQYEEMRVRAQAFTERHFNIQSQIPSWEKIYQA